MSAEPAHVGERSETPSPEAASKRRRRWPAVDVYASVTRRVNLRSLFETVDT